jgi:hypothetical protein
MKEKTKYIIRRIPCTAPYLDLTKLLHMHIKHPLINQIKYVSD